MLHFYVNFQHKLAENAQCVGMKRIRLNCSVNLVANTTHLIIILVLKSHFEI